MKNILVLGTSHVGALKAGFDSLTSEELTDICRNFGKVNFAGFRERLLDNFYLNSNLDLVPNMPRFFIRVRHDIEDDRELKCIPLGKFDLIAIVQGPSPFYPFLYCGDDQVTSTLSSSLIMGICNSLWSSDYNVPFTNEWDAFDRFTYISPCITDVLKNKELKTVYIGTPVPSRECLSDMGRNSIPFVDSNVQKWSTIFSKVWSICEDMNSRDNKFSSKWYLPCPEIIKQNQLYTSYHFFESSVRIDGRNCASDGWHANANYGKTLFLDLLDKVSTFPG